MQAIAGWLGSKLLTNYKHKKQDKKLERWLNKYIEERGEAYATVNNAAFVCDFIKWLEKDIDIYEITSEMVFDHLKQSYTGYQRIWREDARKAINSFLRHWRHRGHKYLHEVYWPQEDKWWHN